MSDRDSRIAEVVDAFLELQSAELDSFLDEQCPEDIRAEVRDLLGRLEAVDSSEFIVEPVDVPITVLLEHEDEQGNAEANILVGALAFQRGNIDAQQFQAVCSTWANERSVPIPQLMVEREWIDDATKSELLLLAERERVKYRDVHVTLGAIANEQVRDAVRELDDTDLVNTISSLPPTAGHILTETVASSNGSGPRYSLTRLHDKGGLGEVWVAHDRELNRDVAFKRLRKRRSSADHIRRRFLKEAQVTGQLGHPNIVPVYELGQDEEHGPFYTMRLVKGETLRDAIAKHHAERRSIKSDPVELQRLLNAFINVCNAISYAHSCGVLHRDLKPANVILGGFGEVIVLDWGLAKLASDDDTESDTDTVESAISVEATATGALLGTPSYMAPEQAAGDQECITTLTDVYGLGAILFEILTGEPPHRSQQDENTKQLLKRIAAGAAPVAVSRGMDVPRALGAICAKAMEKEPSSRYATAQELLDDVQHWMADRPVAAYAEPLGDKVARFTRKHRTATHATTATTLLVAIVAMVSVYFINDARLDEQAQRGAAEEARNNAVQLAGEKAAALEEVEAQRQRAEEARNKALKLANEKSEALQEVETQRQLAESHRLNAVAKAEDAARQAGIAEQRLRQVERTTYNMTVQQAAQLWYSSPTDAAESLVSTENCPADLRDFAWRYVYGLSAQRLQTLPHDEWPYASAQNLTFDTSNRLLCLFQVLPHLGKSNTSVVRWSMNENVEASVLPGYAGPIRGGVLSPDGSLVAYATTDREGEILIWDVLQQKERLRFHHSGWVRSMAFSQDGLSFASVHTGGPVCLWSLTTGFQRHKLDAEAAQEVAFSSDGNRLVTAGKTTSLWETSNGAALKSVSIPETTPETTVFSVALSSDDKSIVVSRSNGLYLLSVETNDVTRVATGHEALGLNLTRAAISPDGTTLANGTMRGRVLLYKLAEPDEAIADYEHGGPILSLAFSPDSSLLASSSTDNSVKVWRVKPPPVVDFTSIGEESTVNATWRVSTISSDFSLVAVAVDDRVLFYSPDDLETPIWTLQAEGVVSLMQFDRTASLLAVGRADSVAIWDIDNQKEIQRFPARKSTVPHQITFSLSSDGKKLAIIQADNSIKLMDVEAGIEFATLTGFEHAASTILLSPDHETVAVGGNGGHLCVWDASSGEVLHELHHRDATIRMLRFSPDSRRLAICDYLNRLPAESSAVVWDLIDGNKELVSDTGGGKLIPSLTFSPSSQRLAIGGLAAPVQVHNFATGTRVELHGATRTSCLAFSHDGKTIAAASEEAVALYDSIDGQLRLRLDNNSGTLVDLSFSDADDRLVAHSLRGQTLLWRADPPQLDESPVASRNVLFVNHAASPDGDGSSWASAYRTVTEAITKATEGDASASQVWVAKGRYTPTPSADEQAASFRLQSGIELYGGFVGDETDLSQRDPARNFTILSGDIERNDQQAGEPVGKNSFHVLTAYGADDTAVLDGFVITAGYSDGRTLDEQTSEARGGGIFISEGDPTIRNCLFRANRARERGGAVYIYNGEPSFINCRFERNYATMGGAMCNVGEVYNKYAQPMKLVRCTFRQNYAVGGGALYSWWGKPMNIVNCEFLENEASGSGAYKQGGGAIHNDSCRIELINTVIRNNKSASPGGALKGKWRPQARLTNCTVVGNESTAGNGGAIHVFNGAFVEVANSILWGNGSDPISLGDANGGRGVNIQHSCIQGGWEGEQIIDEDPQFIRPELGQLQLADGSPCIDVGSDEEVGLDVVDLNVNGRTTEAIPYDFAGDSRFVSSVDLGSHERQEQSDDTTLAKRIEHATLVKTANGLQALSPGKDDAIDLSVFDEDIRNGQGIITKSFAFVQRIALKDCLRLSDQLRTAGYRPLRFRPYSDRGIRVAAAWVRDQRDAHLLVDVVREEIIEENKRRTEQGFRIVDIAGYSDGVSTKYAAVWIASPEAAQPEVYVGIAQEDENSHFQDFRSRGLVPYVRHELWSTERTRTLSMIWYPGETAWTTWGLGRREYEETLKKGECQTDVCVSTRSYFDRSHDYLGFSGCWSMAPGIESIESHDLSIEDHLEACRTFAARGYLPASISVAKDEVSGRVVAASVWQRPTSIASLDHGTKRRRARYDFVNDFLAGLELSSPDVAGSVQCVGDTLEIEYDIRNVSGRAFNIAYDDTGEIIRFLGSRQHYIQYLGSESEEPGEKQGAGGLQIPVDPLVPSGGVTKVYHQWSTKDFRPGKYRFSVELHNFGEPTAKQHVDFELLPRPEVVIGTRLGDMTIELFPASAPKAVENFLTHSKNGFYDKTIFHAVVPDFAIQGGDPTGTGEGGESIWGKPFESEIDQSLNLDYGAVALGSKAMDQNHSQFFIVAKKDGVPKFKGRFTIFGSLVEGFDVLEAIANVETNRQTPVDPVPVKVTLKDSALSVLKRIQESRPSLPQVVIKTRLGEMVLELYPESAPKAVENFLTHARNGFYDKTTFHAIAPDLVIQGGDPSGTGNEGQSIWGKPFETEIDVSVEASYGTLGMANNGGDTNNSQFFIITPKAGRPEFKGRFTLFGRVVEGFETLDRCANVETESDKSKRPVETLPMTIELHESAVQFLRQLENEN